MSGICYLVCAGEEVPLDFVSKKDDFVIAVDGGFLALKRAGIEPHLALGDFDSLGYIPQGTDTVVFDSVKDETDTFAAAQEGLRRGYREFRIYCALGGRLSHTIANIQTLTYLRKQGVNAVIVGDRMRLCVLGTHTEFAAGGYLSLFPLGGEAEVRIGNCKYAGTFVLTPFDSLGASNEPTEGAFVDVLRGNVLAVTEEKERK